MDWSIELPPETIRLDRDNRQRRELKGIDELAESIRTRGQLQPVVITRNLLLVAGERRLTAIRQLADRKIRCVYTDELDPNELQAIELEENIKRHSLPWQDECKAVLRYHNTRCAQYPSNTIEDTAKALGLSDSEIGDRIAVAKEMLNGNKLVLEAPKLSTAKGLVRRANERRVASETSKLLAIASGAVPSPAPSEAPIEVDEDLSILADLDEVRETGYILNEDFINWSSDYDGPKFNLIHCDFPYGVGMHKSDQGSGDAYGSYEDTPEIYWSLLDAFLNNLDNFCEDSAHLVFWFSMDFYSETIARFEYDAKRRRELNLSPGWRVSRFPLIWHKSDNSGILPDPNRGPRRTYETALFASRGDRKIVRPVSSSVAAGIQRGRHMSEKPQPVLRHFFRMLVDEHSTVLDPTAGSGSAIRAAVASGASRYLGLELNPEFAKVADETLKDFLENGDPDEQPNP